MKRGCPAIRTVRVARSYRASHSTTPDQCDARHRPARSFEDAERRPEHESGHEHQEDHIGGSRRRQDATELQPLRDDRRDEEDQPLADQRGDVPAGDEQDVPHEQRDRPGDEDRREGGPLQQEDPERDQDERCRPQDEQRGRHLQWCRGDQTEPTGRERARREIRPCSIIGRGPLEGDESAEQSADHERSVRVRPSIRERQIEEAHATKSADHSRHHASDCRGQDYGAQAHLAAHHRFLRGRRDLSGPARGRAPAPRRSIRRSRGIRRGTDSEAAWDRDR